MRRMKVAQYGSSAAADWRATWEEPNATAASRRETRPGR